MTQKIQVVRGSRRASGTQRATGGTRRLGDALREGQARLAQHIRALDRADPISIHQARVACRRLRALLKTFKPFFSEQTGPAYAQVLGRVAEMLDEVRELDVMSALPELQEAAVAGGVARARDQAVLRLRRRCRLRTNAARLRLARHGPSPGRLRLVRNVDIHAVLKRVRRQWRRAEPGFATASSDRKARHALRIRLKNVRYALEIVADCEPEHAAVLRRRLRRVQELLGDDRDLEAAVAWLRARGGGVAGSRRAVARLARRRNTLGAHVPAALRSLAIAGARWDRAVTRRIRAAS